jgi:hypothetical protein
MTAETVGAEVAGRKGKLLGRLGRQAGRSSSKVKLSWNVERVLRGKTDGKR